MVDSAVAVGCCAAAAVVERCARGGEVDEDVCGLARRRPRPRPPPPAGTAGERRTSRRPSVARRPCTSLLFSSPPCRPSLT